MELKWTKKGLSDLTRLYDFLAPVSQSLTAAPTKLLASPRIGSRLQEFEPREVRRLLVGPYEIRYEIKDSMIYIKKSIDRLWTLAQSPEHHPSGNSGRDGASACQPVPRIGGISPGSRVSGGDPEGPFIMPSAPLPPDEDRRLASVHRLQILDTPKEERFDRLCRLAKHVFKVSLSRITVMDTDRQWFKSVCGQELREIPRELSMCGYTLVEGSTLVIPDCSVDPRVMDNLNVRGLMGIHFYAGVPLRSNDGYTVGTLCILDGPARQFDAEDIAALEDLASCAESEIQLLHISRSEIEVRGEMDQLRRKASVDALTKIWNRGAILEILAKEQDRAKKANEPLAVALLDIDHFKSVNDTYGHDVGDQVLQEFTDRIRSGLRGGEAFGRFGGEEFLIVIPRCNPSQAEAYGENVLQAVRAQPMKTAKGELPVTASMGLAIWRGGFEGADALIKRSDKALYQSKRNGRNRTTLAV